MRTRRRADFIDVLSLMKKVGFFLLACTQTRAVMFENFSLRLGKIPIIWETIQKFIDFVYQWSHQRYMARSPIGGLCFDLRIPFIFDKYGYITPDHCISAYITSFGPAARFPNQERLRALEKRPLRLGADPNPQHQPGSTGNGVPRGR